MHHTDGNWILLPLDCYPFGVEAHGKDAPNTELHGGFSTFEEADKYRKHLVEFYDDYQYVRVVKIETVEPSQRDKEPRPDRRPVS